MRKLESRSRYAIGLRSRALLQGVSPPLSDLQTAYQRMQAANPRLSEAQAFHLTQHGAVQLEDGQFTWKYDQYTYNFHGVGLSEDEIIALWQNISVPTLLINADQGLQNRTGQDDTLQYFRRAQLLT